MLRAFHVLFSSFSMFRHLLLPESSAFLVGRRPEKKVLERPREIGNPSAHEFWVLCLFGPCSWMYNTMWNIYITAQSSRASLFPSLLLRIRSSPTLQNFTPGCVICSANTSLNNIGLRTYVIPFVQRLNGETFSMYLCIRVFLLISHFTKCLNGPTHFRVGWRSDSDSSQFENAHTNSSARNQPGPRSRFPFFILIVPFSC